MILCWNNTLYILSKIKYIIKINFSVFFFTLKKIYVTIRKFKIIYVVSVIFPLDIATLEDSSILHVTDLQILEVQGVS